MIIHEYDRTEIIGNEKTGNDMTVNEKWRHPNDGDELTVTKR